MRSESYSNYNQPVPSKKKKQQLEVKNVTLKTRIISSQDEDVSLQARKTRSLSHQAEDATIDTPLRKHSRKSQEVKKTRHGTGKRDDSDLPLQTHETQGNDTPQAAEEAPRHPTPNVHTTANNSETSRTTANNRVSIVKASKPPRAEPKKKSLPKSKPDSITIKTTNGSLSGDEDQKEREEMLASPVKGLDVETASTVSRNLSLPITLLFTSDSLPLHVRPLSNLRRLTKSPRIARKLSSCNLEKRTSLRGTTL